MADLTREELAELRRRWTEPPPDSVVAEFGDIPRLMDMGEMLPTLLKVLAMAERCAEAEEERDEAWDDLIYQRTTVAEEIESLREQYANAGHGLSAEKYLRYGAATALEERDVARNERDEARAALRKYGRHTDDCPMVVRRGAEPFMARCTCGLSAALGEP